MAKTHHRNLPRPTKQWLSRFKTKLRKIAAGADERMSPEEMTSLLPNVGADLMTKAYLADPDRFIASIDTSVIPFLPQVVVTHIRERVFELHTMPADAGDIFAVPARSMKADQLRVAMRLLLERCQILHTACEQMQSQRESVQLRNAGGEIEVPPDGRDLLSIAPQNMKKTELVTTARLLRERCQKLHAACEQMKGDAGAPFQAIEERRHAAASSLTAVRLWPNISSLLDDPSKQARARFIRIFTAYKILAYREYSTLGQAEARTLKALSSSLKKRNGRRALKQLRTLDSDSNHKGKVALVRLRLYMKRRGETAECPLKALCGARGWLLRWLEAFWMRYGQSTTRGGRLSTQHFLRHVDKCVVDETKARKISGHKHLHLSSPEAITVALRSLKTR